MNATYCGPPPLPDAVWASWNFDPALLVALLALTLVLRRHPAGLAAVGVLAVAFVSPLCPLSAALFSARGVHHVLLVAVAAPLLACAVPSLRAPRIALPFAVSTVVLWAWHVPAAYDLALANVAVYWLMQLSLLASAVWFWRCVFAQEASPIDSLAFVVAGFAQMGMLGAVLTFAPQPLFAAHLAAPFAFGISPVDDQALGGLIMWVPAGIPYAVAAVIVARRGWAMIAHRGAASC
ncbi:cytochrome c oxidase assembly protein [Acuticoccus sp. I52.16.1]|uniref:cytochrome c oxidase assembly protein n=1 Tax=Acuticoccus sp. I52.16.1 TaxID=2928472 RepID=UPI001FD4F115|nr:cytochrome c oxidase assembly protein [Acuticoccus sp. I52.16.1]UOM32578.1 cytochrome c oxidase assembly protein [Acuticoccus sp. I52.16.1]